jgi:hypothetical protein
MPKPLAPVEKRKDGYWVDTSELLGPGCEYGPYETVRDADEDRNPVIDRLKARRQLGITGYDEACVISAHELKLAVKLLGKMTKGSMRVERLNPDQRKTISLLLYKWKGPGSLGEETLASLDTLKGLLYWEAGIDPTWPEADESFVQWAISYGKE